MFERDTDRDWHKLAESDPYFAVLTDPKFKSGNLDAAAREEFFASGEHHVAAVFRLIETHVDPSFKPDCALDFGCGVGRLVAPLARRCPEIVGVDVAEPMLREARTYCASQGLTNASFIRDVSEWKGTFDFVHSVIVFQHIPPARGMVIARELVRRLAHGGVGALHFTYAVPGSRRERLRLWTQHHVPLAHEFLNVMGGRPATAPLMEMNEYDLNALARMLSEEGVREVYSHLTDHGGHLGAYLFFKKTNERPQF